MTESTPAERLRRARVAKGYASAAEAARAHGWPEVTYTSHENGTRGLRLDAAKRYSRAFGIPLAGLIGVKIEPEVQRVPVVGVAAVGVWRDEIALDAERPTNGRSPNVLSVGATTMSYFAWEVSDASVNRSIGPGEHAVIEPVDESAVFAVPVGALVAVERKRGQLLERSIRRAAAVVRGEVTLETYSTERRLQETISYPSKRADEIVRVVGRVVGKYADLRQ